jgi:hypothetical protein
VYDDFGNQLINAKHFFLFFQAVLCAIGSKKVNWVAKLVAQLFATAALWVRIQTSLKYTKWATKAKEWPTQYSPSKNIQKTYISSLSFVHPRFTQITQRPMHPLSNIQ